jgi:hypothetical protein
MPSRGDNGRDSGGPEEAAHYVAGRAAELAQIARRHRLDMLGYLLDMAHLEAQEVLRRRSPSNGRS